MLCTDVRLAQAIVWLRRDDASGDLLLRITAQCPPPRYTSSEQLAEYRCRCALYVAESYGALRRLEAIEQCEAAWELFKGLKRKGKSSELDRWRIASGFVLCGAVERAEEIARGNKPCPSWEEMQSLIADLERTGQWDEAFQRIEASYQAISPRQPYRKGYLAEAYGRYGQFAHAWAIAQSIADFTHHMEACRMLALRTSAAGEVEFCNDVLRHAIRVSEESLEQSPWRWAMCLRLDWSWIDPAIVKRLRRAVYGQPPTEALSAEVAAQWAVRYAFRDEHRLATPMLEKAVALLDGEGDLRVRAEVMDLIARAWARMGDLDQAMHWLQQIYAVGGEAMRPSAPMEMIDYCDPERALELIAPYRPAVAEPNRFPPLAAKSAARARKWDVAWAWCQRNRLWADSTAAALTCAQYSLEGCAAAIGQLERVTDHRLAAIGAVGAAQWIAGINGLVAEFEPCDVDGSQMVL